MKRIKLLGLIALLPTLCLVNSGCHHCKEVSTLCDLAIASFTAPSEVTLGQAFDLETGVTNNAEVGECTTTEEASATLNLIEIFLKDNTGNWNPILADSTIEQPAILSGQTITLLKALTIFGAGDFRIDYCVDYPNLVKERNENDNCHRSAGYDIVSDIQKINNFASAYVTVLPLPDGTTEIKGKPIVEFH